MELQKGFFEGDTKVNFLPPKMGANNFLVLISAQNRCNRSIETRYNLFHHHTMLQSLQNAGKAPKCDFLKNQAVQRMLKNSQKRCILGVGHGGDKSKKILGGNLSNRQTQEISARFFHVLSNSENRLTISNFKKI